MQIKYTPEDGSEPQSWEFNPRRVRQSEAALIERQYGKPYEQFAAEAMGGSVRALRLAIWHVMKRAHASLRFDDVPDFYVDEIEVTHSSSELREARDNIVRANLDAAERDQALSIVDGQIAVAEAREAAGESESGK